MKASLAAGDFDLTGFNGGRDDFHLTGFNGGRKKTERYTRTDKDRQGQTRTDKDRTDGGHNTMLARNLC